MYSKIYATENQNSYPEMGLRLLGFSGFAPEPGAAHSPIPHCVCWLEMGLRIPRNWLSFYDGLVHGIELRERWRLGLRRAAGSRVAVLKAPSRGCVETPTYTWRGPLVFGDWFLLLLTFPYLISLTVLQMTILCRNH